MATKTLEEAAKNLMTADRLLESAEMMKALGLPQSEIDLVIDWALTLASAPF
jgi:predicted DNA-binding transcriptional regulator AlpA